MKKILSVCLVLAALMFAGCDTITGLFEDEPDDPVVTQPEVKTKTVYVKNSKWETVKTAEVIIPARAAITEADLEAEIIAYNLAHTDDQLTSLETDVPLAESPLIDIYMVNRTTHEINEQFLDWDRVDYVTRYDTFLLQASGTNSVIYVDNIPPAPPTVVDTRPDYEKYAIYLVAATGAIMFEEHCADIDWAAGGSASLIEYYRLRVSMLELEARGQGHGVYVVAGRLYTTP